MIFGIAAYAMWGLFPLYWPLLKPAEASEILAHRILWSLFAVVAILAVRRHWSWVRSLTLKQVGLLALAAMVISVNWGMYIYGVNSGHTIETSLGYFINPLISVVLGVVVFQERLRRMQWAAIALGAAAVIVLTADYGRLPWIALTLACSFGTYGLLKKFANTPSAESLTVETSVLLLPALAFTLMLHSHGDATFGNAGAAQALLLVGGGVITAVPLMLFNASAIRLPMTTVGLLQYLAPTLQFLIGLLVQHEQMPASRWIGFLLVWVALVILTYDGVRGSRRQRRQVVPAVTPEPVASLPRS
ncbi:EamA family transporter RarD [Actinomadura alba]|uniref:EamA family transporter RarD n=1 Tax=Actinomadura alba TaxID=406431 RepID=A0ABR7LW36_9ACTN|nr:EamA family transporter RarD [Actinomadura alba]